MSAPAVICPLSFEARAARRVLPTDATIIISAPGEKPTRAATQAAIKAGHKTIILFGVAGAIRDAPAAASLHAVRTKTHDPIFCPLVPTGPQACTLHEPLYSVERKAALCYEMSPEVSIIDCESWFFADECTRASVRWLVIRSISDGPADALPIQTIRWTNSAGKTRKRVVIKDALKDPSLISPLIALARRSSKNLKAATRLLADAYDQLTTHDDPPK